MSTASTQDSVFDLDGKVALVTGGTSGIGRAAAEMLAAHGCRVAINYAANDKRAAEVEDAIEGSKAFKADISDPEVGPRLVADVVQHFGKLDVLVHSAGISKRDDTNPHDFDRVVKVHLHSTHALLPAAADAMDDSGGGSIIVLTSIANNKGSATSYGAAMAGKLCYSLGFARLVAKRNIRVNAVAAGTIFTEMVNPFFKSNAARREHTEKVMPLWDKREGIPEGDQVGKVILFLASDLASHLTGEEIRVNGGQWIAV
ncbi:MAG: SDR family NAD(P)-dependent oxidoreductase [Planctomycetota bacterium]